VLVVPRGATWWAVAALTADSLGDVGVAWCRNWLDDVGATREEVDDSVQFLLTGNACVTWEQ